MAMNKATSSTNIQIDIYIMLSFISMQLCNVIFALTLHFVVDILTTLYHMQQHVSNVIFPVQRYLYFDYVMNCSIQACDLNCTVKKEYMRKSI